MASAKGLPTQDLQAGAAALDEDIPRVLKLLDAPSIEALGWTRVGRLTLLVPMTAMRDDKQDAYLLRLGFQAYRRWPPSAQFVNPETRIYSHPHDRHAIPQLTSPECHTHAEYRLASGNTMQLVCCSATLEFYEIAHNVEPHHVWRDSDTFYTTIVAIRRAFASHYQGRYPAYGK
jgi:hypothetical protein